MTNRYILKRGTQKTGLSVKIGRYSFDSQQGIPAEHQANVGCSNFMHAANDVSNYPTQIQQRKKWTREEKKGCIL